MHSYLSLKLLARWMSAWKHDYKHSRRYNNKHPFSSPGRPASTRSASEQTLDAPWSNNPIGHKHINHYADATCYSPIHWIPRPSSFHSSLSGGGLGGAVGLRQTQANKATHAEALSRSLSRERCAASISAAVSGGRHPSGGACMAHMIEREPLQTGISWRRLDFWPRLIGSGQVLASRHQLQRCVHDVRDHRCSSCGPLDAAPSLPAKGLAERCSIPNWGSSSCKCRWAPSQDAKVQSGTIVSVNKITLLRNDLTDSLSHHGILNRNTHSNNTIKTHPKTAL